MLELCSVILNRPSGSSSFREEEALPSQVPQDYFATMHPHQELDEKFQKLVSRSEAIDMNLIAIIDARQKLVVEFQDFRTRGQYLDANMRSNVNSVSQEQFEKTRKDLETQRQALQHEHARITAGQQAWLNSLDEYFSFTRDLEELVVSQLNAWKRDQQLGGNGGQCLGEQHLNKIQEWCEALATVIYRSIIQLKKFSDQTLSRTNDDPLFAKVELLKEHAKQFLQDLAQKTFLIEKQPPQVMKTNTRFMSTLRLLCGHALNIHKSAPTVKVSIISETTAQKFMLNPTQGPIPAGETSGAIGNDKSNLDFHESTKQMTANFRNMQLSKIRRTEKKGTESVMDEKFALLFQCHFKLADDFVFYIWTLSLPVVVIVHGNQEPHAHATITWDNAFAAPNRTPYQVPEKVVWHRMAEVLSMKFRQYVGRPLTRDALKFLAGKAFRMPMHTGDFDNLVLSWAQFAKEPLSDRSFTFWEWFYAVLKVTREYLRPLWQEQTMLGFISRKQTEDLLTQCQQGTFLLRFSDSELGGVTIAWVGESTQEVGVPEVFMVQPFTTKDFAIRGLADRINDLKNLHYLFPNVPKDTVFGKFYSRVSDQPPLANGYVKSFLALTLPG